MPLEHQVRARRRALEPPLPERRSQGEQDERRHARQYAVSDAHIQVHYLPGHTNTKKGEQVDLDDDGTPETLVLGYPEYDSGGTVVSGGLTLGVSF